MKAGHSSGPAPADEMSAEEIRDTAFGFWRSRILLTAYELGVFTILEDGGKTSSEVARALGADGRATDRLMNALCAIGLLEKGAGRFTNTATGSRLLVRGSPEYMKGLMHSVHLWDTWTTLSQAVRQGTSVASGPVNDRGDAWLTSFIEAMDERASRHAPVVAGMLDLSAVSRALDVGGGSGAYAMAFVRARRGMRATVFDLPNVALLTREHVQRQGLSETVEIVTGDYNTDDLGSGFDMAFLSAIIHSNSEEQNRCLLRKCSDALNRGGRVVVQDFIVDEDRTGPTFAALFSLNMLVGTESGDTFTENEVRSWMEAAGLSQCTRADTPFGTTLITGRKAS